MIRAIQLYRTDCTDPHRNLAVEQYLLETVPEHTCTLYLWQNRRTVVIGRNQNPWKECRTTQLEADGGFLSRRLSGGGAVFHDLGNLNFTFLVRKEDYDLDRQLSVIAEAGRALGISVICVSLMCAFRGYSQGRQNMVPTAVSQFIEAFVKLVIGLPLAWYLIHRGLGLDIGAAGAIVGVSAGIVLAMLYMCWEYFRNRGPILGGTDIPQSYGTIIRRLLVLGIPIAIGQAGMSLLNMIDQSVILGQLQDVLGLEETVAAALYGQYTFSSTLFNLPSSFLPAVAVSLIPAISVAVTRRDHQEVNRVVSTSFRLIAVLAIPAGVGLSVLARPILLLLYPARQETALAATYHLQLLGIASIFVCVMLLTNSIMQAHGKVHLPIITTLIGGVVKVLVNFILVGNPDINIKGAPVGTIICYALIALINLAIVYRLLEEKPRYLRIFAKPVLASAIMGASAWASYGLLSRVLSGGYAMQALATVGAVGIAVAVYLVLVIALRMITREDLQMVPKGDALARLLHIR